MPPVSVELKRSVKAANDIVDVVSAYITVTPNGKTFKAVCPFHDDTRPSLQIDRHYQNFRCWACDAHGDAFDFVMKFEKVQFGEALRLLAERAHIVLAPEQCSPEDLARARLIQVMRWAEEQYSHCLLESQLASAARQYIGSRKLSGAFVRQFGLGFAPVTGDWLVRLANQEGIAPERLLEVGLIAARDGNRGFYDRFRDRVMFPIRDIRGRTVGFGGRVLPDSPLSVRGPKYYNSSDTPLFNKSELLYGLDLARHPGASAGFLAVVEGYTDVMMAHQCGVANVVATMGTALNARHVAQLRRYVPKVVLVFDSDDAGDSASSRALELFWSQNDFEIGIATLPDGADPCDLLSQPDGPDQFRQQLQNHKSVLDYKIDAMLAKYSAHSIEDTKRIVDSVLAVMALAPSIPSAAAQVKQELAISRLAHRLNLRQETVWARLGELRTEQRRRDANSHRSSSSFTQAPLTQTPPPAGGPPPAIERQLLEILLAEPTLVAEAVASVDPARLTHTGLRRVLTELYALHNVGERPDLDALRVRLIDRPDLAAAALRLQDVGRQIPERHEWFAKIVRRFAEQRAEVEKRRLKDQLAGGAVDEHAAVELLRRIQAGSA
ncbi:MAG: DNA primase [Bacteroidales bacterium]|nr:DNA primase [Bacteroidales bacterium]